MSRTDKDRPIWVREEDATELRYERHYCGEWRGQVLECDIDTSDKYRFAADGGPRPLWTGRRYRRCGYRLVDFSPYGHAPKEFVDHVWNNVERRRVRDELTEVRKLANAGQDDLDFANYQHRHCARWLWE